MPIILPRHAIYPTSSVLHGHRRKAFVASRAALAVTAFAPPFIVMLSAASGRSALDGLGPLVMASTAASVLASYLWGRLSDHCSRQCSATNRMRVRIASPELFLKIVLLHH